MKDGENGGLAAMPPDDEQCCWNKGRSQCEKRKLIGNRYCEAHRASSKKRNRKRRRYDATLTLHLHIHIHSGETATNDGEDGGPATPPDDERCRCNDHCEEHCTSLKKWGRKRQRTEDQDLLSEKGLDNGSSDTEKEAEKGPKSGVVKGTQELVIEKRHKSGVLDGEYEGPVLKKYSRRLGKNKVSVIRVLMNEEGRGSGEKVEDNGNLDEEEDEGVSVKEKRVTAKKRGRREKESFVENQDLATENRKTVKVTIVENQDLATEKGRENGWEGRENGDLAVSKHGHRPVKKVTIVENQDLTTEKGWENGREGRGSGNLAVNKHGHRPVKKVTFVENQDLPTEKKHGRKAQKLASEKGPENGEKDQECGGSDKEDKDPSGRSTWSGYSLRTPAVPKQVSVSEHKKKMDRRWIEEESLMCHQCQRNDKGRVVRCTKCRRKRFCIPCIQNWYPYMSEEAIAEACPFCRGNCNCKACLRLVGPLKNKLRLTFSDQEKVQHS